jgi:predicted phage tail protein
VPFTRFKAMLIGILFLVVGIALLVGDVLIPGFLWGASLGGIWVVLAPFGLLFLGGVMIIASLVDTEGKRAGKKKKNKVEKTD